MAFGLCRYVTVFVIGLVLVSCGGKHGKAKVSVHKNDSVDLKIGMMPVIDCLPFYVAGYDRMFQKNGTRIKVITYNSAIKCGSALMKGEIDGAFLTLPEMLYLNARGVNLKAVMRTNGDVAIVTSRTKRIKKLSSMRERTIAVSRHNTSDFLVDEIAQITKIKPFDLLRPQINDVGVRYKMLVNNQVDAAALPAPYLDMAIMKGNVKVFSSQNAKVKFGSICFLGSAIKNKPEHIKAMLSSYKLSVEKINKNRHGADSVLFHIYRIPSACLDSVKMPKYEFPQGVDKKDLHRAIEWSVRRGFVSSRPEVSEVLSDKFIKQ